jgi:hypothetical protein
MVSCKTCQRRKVCRQFADNKNLGGCLNYTATKKGKRYNDESK